MAGQVVDAQLGIDILVDKGEDVINLGVVGSAVCYQEIGRAFVVKDAVQENHEFGEDSLFLQIGPEAGKTSEFMDEIAETVLIFFGQMEFMRDIAASVVETVIQVCDIGREAFKSRDRWTGRSVHAQPDRFGTGSGSRID